MLQVRLGYGHGDPELQYSMFLIAAIENNTEWAIKDMTVDLMVETCFESSTNVKERQ